MINEDVFVETQSVSTDYDLNDKPMSKNHSRVHWRLSQLLGKYEDKYDIMPEFDIKLATGKAKPDLAIFPKSLTFDWWKDESWTEETPITAIEIVSPSQPVDEIIEKITDTFFMGGVQSAWLVLPALQTVYILTADRKRAVYAAGEFTDPATGITLTVEDIFK